MADLSILSVEVYDGALDGDDRDPNNPASTEIWWGQWEPNQPAVRRYPNAMGAQPGSIYQPGPERLASDDDAAIRMSSAWAADWAVVMDGSALAQVTDAITVTVDFTSVHVDPDDRPEDRYFELGLVLFDWAQYEGWQPSSVTGGMNYAYAEASFRVEAGESRRVEWVINEAWLNGTHANDGDMDDFDKGNHWYDTDPPDEYDDEWMPLPRGPESFTEFRDRLLAGTDSKVTLWLRQNDGGYPWETDVSYVRIGVPAPAIAGRPDMSRRRFT